MALVAHTIVSRYTPQQREPITQLLTTEDDPWQTESSFGPAQRLHSRVAPHFVAGTLKCDEYGIPRSNVITRPEPSKRGDTLADLGTWYRSLQRRGDEAQHSARIDRVSSLSVPSRSATRKSQFLRGDQPRPKTANWFSSSRTDDAFGSTSVNVSKPSTFADLLSRNPPPLPSEPTFKPPIFLALGPDNRGFAMLQRKGWREGEGLGARVERKTRQHPGMKGTRSHDRKPAFRGFARTSTCATASSFSEGRTKVIDLTLSDSEPNETHEVVDLTLSDSQSEPDLEPEDEGKQSETLDLPDSQSHGMTLLTPIATTLKADRLGIGLKARQRSYTAKMKAVTHTPSALAAHTRSAEKMRQEKKKYGRGWRGFARSKRKEERQRVEMLAYMNS